MGESIIYRPYMSCLDGDGTLHLSVSLYDEDGHSSLMRDISPSDDDYHFWRWLLDQEQFQCSLNEESVADARAQFERGKPLDISGTWQSESTRKDALLGDTLFLGKDGQFCDTMSSNNRRRIGHWTYCGRVLCLDYETDGQWRWLVHRFTEQRLVLMLEVFGGPPPVTYRRISND